MGVVYLGLPWCGFLRSNNIIVYIYIPGLSRLSIRNGPCVDVVVVLDVPPSKARDWCVLYLHSVLFQFNFQKTNSSSHGGPIEWTLKSPDLNLLDFLQNANIFPLVVAAAFDIIHDKSIRPLFFKMLENIPKVALKYFLLTIERLLT